MKKHLAVDLDGVVLDFVGGIIEAVYSEQGVLIAECQVFEWDLGRLLNPILGENWWKWLKSRSWLWAKFPPIPGAIGALRRLRASGHYLEAVTSKPDWAEPNLWRWIAEHQPPFQRITIVGEGENKTEATDAPLLLDDKIQNCEDFVAAGRTALLFNHYYNQQKRLPAGITRVHDWKAVLRKVEAWEVAA